jgi:c-di-GMP-binding flagellar brake protein YcgR
VSRVGARGDTRSTARIQPYLAACRVIHDEERLTGYVTDLSARGCQVVTEADAPPAASRVILEVRLGRGVAHARLPAEVIWRNTAPDTGHRVFGLTFQLLDPDQQQALQGIVDEFQRRVAEIET